jgi:hypothetical protein
MTRVRRYSRSARVVTEIQPNYTPPSSAAAETFKQIRNGFDAGVKFLRPAVEQEQTARGEQEALAAVDDQSFEMRKPFSIRDAAFNATGERVVTNRAMIELDEQMNAALQKADGRISVLNSEMDRIRGEVGGSLPEINGLQTRWLESFERGASTARRQTTELAQRRAIAAQRQAAADAAQRAENEIARLALTAGTPDELAAALTDGMSMISEYGPRGEFELNGVTYPADPSRAGIMSANQLASLQSGLSLEAHEIFLRADYERSDNPAGWASEFRESVLSGNSPIPPAQALTMLGQFERAARADENARLSREREIERTMLTQAEQGMAPFVTAQENGVIVAVEGQQRQDILDAVRGNARLTTQVNNWLAASDAVVELQDVAPDQRAAYIERAYADFAATDGINAQEAAVIEALAPYLDQAKAAISNETVGVSAAEQILNSGGTLDPDQIAEMRVNAGGNPDILASIDVFEDAMSVIDSLEGMDGVQREEVLNRLDTATAELAIQGGRQGAAAQRRLQGLELAREHYETLGEKANEDVAAFAADIGVPLEPMPTAEDATLADAAQVIANRVAAMRPHTANYGNDTPVPLASSEIEFLSDFLRNTNNAQRIEFMSGVLDMGEAQSNAILSALGAENPPLLAAGRVARSNPAASRTILAGMQVNVSAPDAVKQAAELSIRPVVMQGNLTNETLAQVRTTAEAYARGMAARNNLTEIAEDDLKKGYDIAMGADQNGNGGIEEINGRGVGDNFGVAILPTGVSGTMVGDLLQEGLREENYADFAGGVVIDGLGRTIDANSLRLSINGFRTINSEDGASLLVPTYNGELFMVQKPDGSTDVFSFDPRGN